MTTRQRILDEATRQVLGRGYVAFTIAAVRDALGLSSGSMFHAFSSKPDLVGAVYVEGMRGYQDAAVAAITAQSDARASIEAWIHAHLSWVSAQPDLARFLFSTQPDEVIEASAAALADANAAFYKAVQDLFAAAVADGLVAPLPRAVAHSLVMGPTQEYCRQWTRGSTDEDPRDSIELFQGAALEAMRSTQRTGSIDV